MIFIAEAPSLPPPAASVSKETRDAGQETKFERRLDENRPSGIGVSAYVGFDAGYAMSQSQRPLEASKKGFQLGLKALGSVFTNDLLLDLGGGFFYNKLAAGASATDTYLDAQGRTVVKSGPQIITRAGYFEFSPRLLLGKGWQLGPVGQVFFGTETTFDPSERERKSTVLAGLDLTVAGGKETLWRAGIQALTDLNLLDRRIILTQLKLQMGLPLLKQATIVSERERIQKKEEITKRRVDNPVTKVFIKEVVRLLFESQIVNFETNSAKLSAQSDYFLTETGKFLAANPTLWGAVVVEGHTDARGPRDRNVQLSQTRAESVRQALLRGGVNANKVKALGLGPDKPLDPAAPADSAVALARNRRVELNFSDVKDAEALKEGISKIRREMGK